MKVYILMDDYTDDTGSTIYGVFSTREKAQTELEKLSSDDNEYGFNINRNGTIDIVVENVK